jgi:hypothetical protein
VSPASLDRLADEATWAVQEQSSIATLMGKLRLLEADDLARYRAVLHHPQPLQSGEPAHG